MVVLSLDENLVLSLDENLEKKKKKKKLKKLKKLKTLFVDPRNNNENILRRSTKSSWLNVSLIFRGINEFIK